ncbi:hypothetical protein FKM82_014223 [Ascaphus truei]
MWGGVNAHFSRSCVQTFSEIGEYWTSAARKIGNIFQNSPGIVEKKTLKQFLQNMNCYIDNVCKIPPSLKSDRKRNGIFSKCYFRQIYTFFFLKGKVAWAC